MEYGDWEMKVSSQRDPWRILGCLLFEQKYPAVSEDAQVPHIK
jgi:hypothetical protein